MATVNSCITENSLVNTRIPWFHRLTVTYILLLSKSTSVYLYILVPKSTECYRDVNLILCSTSVAIRVERFNLYRTVRARMLVGGFIGASRRVDDGRAASGYDASVD